MKIQMEDNMKSEQSLKNKWMIKTPKGEMNVRDVMNKSGMPLAASLIDAVDENLNIYEWLKSIDEDLILTIFT